MSDSKKVLILALTIFLVLLLGVYASYRYTKDRTPGMVLPGGITYLGPSPTPLPAPAGTESSLITIPPGTTWSAYQGKLFPYAFSYPSSLSLGVFPNDPYDGVTIFWGHTNPQNNLLLRVENLNKLHGMAKYVSEPKEVYVKNWWRQYGYEGAGRVTKITNSQGLVGYRARYAGSNFDNVFFEVPNHPELVIWLTGKLLDQVTFDKIIDSLSWK